ncbi:uncharacterized protein MYCFIDRAFT_173060 [Pseudocercospora fijiensis CIRAD86]|uniref:Uncharacterized protein n=1 Tax=Pseudocercospora fijiensis (strain CIRAD86) TaxID=383855 RepID=M2ZYH4_PSEFD|nr:uncharacterized protein MYCFIDRAFT_173060 [Pseudocercospora fijiensis CIRAD86]EME83999.1 hypothetical protein MYCFIDRAFT_173060 [Pseudocercospora fijiensis CIRAD86]
MPEQSFTGVFEIGVQSSLRSIPRLKLDFTQGPGLQLQYTCTFNYTGDTPSEHIPSRRTSAAILALVQSLNDSPTDQARKICKKVVDGVTVGRASFERLTEGEKSNWRLQIAQLQKANTSERLDYRPEVQWMGVLWDACRPDIRGKLKKNIAFRIRLFKQLMLRLIGRSPSIAVYMAGKKHVLPNYIGYRECCKARSGMSLDHSLADLSEYCIDVVTYSRAPMADGMQALQSAGASAEGTRVSEMALSGVKYLGSPIDLVQTYLISRRPAFGNDRRQRKLPIHQASVWRYCGLVAELESQILTLRQGYQTAPYLTHDGHDFYDRWSGLEVIAKLSTLLRLSRTARVQQPLE